MTRTLSICFWLCLLISLPLQANTWPSDYDASYKLKKYNTTIAVANIQLSREQNQLRYSSTTEPRGLAAMFSSDIAEENSTLESIKSTDSDSLRLLRYDFTRKNKSEKNHSFAVTWQTNDAAEISGHYGKKLFQLQHKGTIWDRFSVQLALSSDIQSTEKLESGQRYSYNIIDRGKPAQYHFFYIEKASIKIAGKTYVTLKFERPHGSGKKISYLWLAEELDFIPVKIEQYKKDNLHLTMTLDKYTQK